MSTYSKLIHTWNSKSKQELHVLHLPVTRDRYSNYASVSSSRYGNQIIKLLNIFLTNDIEEFRRRLEHEHDQN